MRPAVQGLLGRCRMRMCIALVAAPNYMRGAEAALIRDSARGPVHSHTMVDNSSGDRVGGGGAQGGTAVVGFAGHGPFGHYLRVFIPPVPLSQPGSNTSATTSRPSSTNTAYGIHWGWRWRRWRAGGDRAGAEAGGPMVSPRRCSCRPSRWVGWGRAKRSSKGPRVVADKGLDAC